MPDAEVSSGAEHGHGGLPVRRCSEPHMNTSMITIGVGQLRSDTLCYLDRVESGEVFEVLSRGRPVARLLGVLDPDQVGGGMRVPMADLRRRAGRLLGRVAAGETIVIERYGRTVATLQPCAPSAPVRPHRIRPVGRRTAVS